MFTRIAVCSLALLFVVAGCGGGGAPNLSPGEAPAAAVVESVEGHAPELLIGDWTAYPDPPGDDLEPSETVPLNDARWPRVAAELACAGRVKRGDADAHRLAARRVLHFHQTSAQAVMDYGIAVNLDAGRAARLGSLVASAAEHCR